MFATSRKESTGSEVSKEIALNYTKAPLLLYFCKRLSLSALF